MGGAAAACLPGPSLAADGPSGVSFGLAVVVALFFLVLWLRDRRRMSKLLDWLRGPLDTPPPTGVRASG